MSRPVSRVRASRWSDKAAAEDDKGALWLALGRAAYLLIAYPHF